MFQKPLVCQCVKYDSFCNSVWHERKIVCFELPISPVVAVLAQNQNEDIWKFHGSLTLNKSKLICDFRSLWYAIVSNMTHFFQLVWHERKMACFEQCVSPLLIQNQHIWNFHGSLILNKRKLICDFRSPWHGTVSTMTHFSVILA